MLTSADGSPDPTRDLADAADRWAAAHLPGLLEEAGRQAAEAVTAVLRRTMVDAALRQAASTLGGAPASGDGAAPVSGRIVSSTGAEVGRSDGATTRHRLGACYVFAVMAAGDAGSVDVSAPSVRLATVDDMAALVTDVDAVDYGPDRIQELLGDQKWVEERARAHDRVISAAMACGPVLPFRFLTVVRTQDDVEELLRRHAHSLRDGLSCVAGRQEWGVRILLDRRVMARALDGASASAPPSTGAAWLAARQRRQRIEDEMDAVASRLVDECHQRLSDCAERTALRPAGRQHDAEAGDTLLNASYLVAEDAVADFRVVAGELGERHDEIGLRVELTGPWAPYSFVEIQL
ncbi:MAG TPA: GvpL/GvpF family gas vesicle protein [Acidimicrobiales bacterium]|nr:GvpL/GvpF family gas vesicle protein [Acidimicrobiales bacterium]